MLLFNRSPCLNRMKRNTQFRPATRSNLACQQLDGEKTSHPAKNRWIHRMLANYPVHADRSSDFPVYWVTLSWFLILSEAIMSIQSRLIRMAPVSLPRRRFLQGLLSSGLFAAAAGAVPPIHRNGTAKFKFSLAAYSYRDLLTGDKPPLTLLDFVEDCAKLGLEGTELTSYYFPPGFDRAYLINLKRCCFELGLDVSGTAVGNDFGVRDPAKRAEQISLVKTWIEHAEVLGAPVIRIFAGHAEEGCAREEAHRLMVEGIEECCDYAGRHGVFLALENHGGPTADADGLLRFVNDIQSPWFAVNMDTGNFHSADIYADLARIAPYAANVQVKVMTSGPDGKATPSDFGRLAAILRDAGYRGYIVLEFEESEDPRVACPKWMKQLRDAFEA